jgi:hypothetical protein
MLMMICLTTSVGALRLRKNQHSFIIPPNPISDLLNQTLVDSHLESIPGLGSFTTGCLSSRDLEGLSWETDGTLHAQFLALGTFNEFLADLLEGLHFAGGQCDSDFVLFLRKYMSVCVEIGRKLWEKSYGAFAELLFWLLVGHDCGEFPSRLERYSYGKVMKVIVVRCGVDWRNGEERSSKFREFGCGLEVLAWRLSEANSIGAGVSQPCCIVIIDWDFEEATQ